VLLRRAIAIEQLPTGNYGSFPTKKAGPVKSMTKGFGHIPGIPIISAK